MSQGRQREDGEEVHLFVARKVAKTQRSRQRVMGNVNAPHVNLGQDQRLKTLQMRIGQDQRNEVKDDHERKYAKQRQYQGLTDTIKRDLKYGWDPVPASYRPTKKTPAVGNLGNIDFDHFDDHFASEDEVSDEDAEHVQQDFMKDSERFAFNPHVSVSRKSGRKMASRKKRPKSAFVKKKPRVQQQQQQSKFNQSDEEEMKKMADKLRPNEMMFSLNATKSHPKKKNFKKRPASAPAGKRANARNTMSQPMYAFFKQMEQHKRHYGPTHGPQSAAFSPGRELEFVGYDFRDDFIRFAQMLFLARCHDLMIQPSYEKEERFVFLLCKNCHPVTHPAGTYFDGSNCKLGYLGLRCVNDFLMQQETYQHVLLGDNPIGDDGVDAILPFLQDNDVLLSLDLQSAKLGSHGFAKLMKVLKTTSNLISFNGSSYHNDGVMTCGHVGLKAVYEFLSEHTNIQKLKLDNCGLANIGFKYLAQGLRRNNSVMTLSLARNSLTNKHLKLLAAALPEMPCLLNLNLAHNLVNDYSLSLLCSSLRECEGLLKLDLCNNRIQLQGFTLLTDVLGNMIGLQKLLLDNNMLARGKHMAWDSEFDMNLEQRRFVESELKRRGLGDSIVSERMVSEYSTLRHLSMDGNEMDGTTAHELLHVMEHSKTIQTMSLSKNRLADDGSIALAGFLARAGSVVQTIRIDNNDITDGGGEKLGSALVQNAQSKRPLTMLSLKDNTVGEKTGELLLKALHFNKQLRLNAEDATMPYVMQVKLEKSSNRNEHNFRNKAAERHQAEIDVLLLKQDILHEKEQENKECEKMLQDMEIHLENITASRGSWAQLDAEELKELQDEMNRKILEHRDLEIQLHQTEHETATFRRVQGRTIDNTKQQIEVTRRAVKAAERSRQQIYERRDRMGKHHDDEIAQLNIVLQREKKKLAETTSSFRDEYNRIYDFDMTIQRDARMKAAKEEEAADKAKRKATKAKNVVKKKRKVASRKATSPKRALSKKKNPLDKRDEEERKTKVLPLPANGRRGSGSIRLGGGARKIGAKVDDRQKDVYNITGVPSSLHEAKSPERKLDVEEKYSEQPQTARSLVTNSSSAIRASPLMHELENESQDVAPVDDGFASFMQAANRQSVFDDLALTKDPSFSSAGQSTSRVPIRKAPRFKKPKSKRPTAPSPSKKKRPVSALRRPTSAVRRRPQSAMSRPPAPSISVTSQSGKKSAFNLEHER